MPSDKFLTYLVSDWQVWPALRQRLIRSRPQISIISCRLRGGSGGSVSFQLSVRPMKLRAAWKAASGLWSVSARREKAELWTQTHSVTQSCRPHWLCRLETPPTVVFDGCSHSSCAQRPSALWSSGLFTQECVEMLQKLEGKLITPLTLLIKKNWWLFGEKNYLLSCDAAWPQLIQHWEGGWVGCGSGLCFVSKWLIL